MFKIEEVSDNNFFIIEEGVNGEQWELGAFSREGLELLADMLNAFLEAEDAYDGPEQETPIEQMYAYADQTKRSFVFDGVEVWYFKPAN